MYWLNLCVGYAIDCLKINQFESWSDSDCVLTDMLCNAEKSKLSLYTLIKILKQNLDRVSSMMFKENIPISNESLASHRGISAIIKKLQEFI